MHEQPKGSAALIVIILLAGLALAAANIGVVLLMTKGTLDVSLLGDLARDWLPGLLYFAAAPVLAALLVVLIVSRRPSLAPADQKPSAAPSAQPATPSPAPALRLLAFLQQEGRLIDFLSEDIDGYDDAQVGTAVRSIHAACRKALHERIQLERILDGEDGSPVVIEAGFDPAAIRLTGNVAGNPPFRGTLQHTGWRATTITLPQSPGGADPNIIEPAEVEIP